MIQTALRITGAIITALSIPLAVLGLFGLQGIGGSTHETILSITWVIINFIGIPFIFIGFILHYKIRTATYLAIAHVVVSLLIIASILSNTIKGDAVIPLIATLPATLYIIGVLVKEK